MDVRLRWFACIALACTACVDDTTERGNATGVSVPNSAGQTPETWTITPEGIGPLRLGEPLVEPPGGFEERYRTSFYGDRQPLEGFVFDDPPVLAVFKNGPFSSWGSKYVGHSAFEPVETAAVAFARAKRFKVEMLVITDQRPQTEAGISVGDDYEAFARAYPRAPAPEAFVGLWEQPSCMVSRDTIWFFFDRCDDASRAKIIRIAVRTHGSQV